MKRVWITVWAVLFLVFAAAGCGTTGRNFDATKVRNIQNNVTSQAEILDWFGVPWKEGTENNHIMWTYEFNKWKMFGEPESKDLVILFDKNNVVKAYRFTSSLEE